jgi:hypothetical protein
MQGIANQPSLWPWPDTLDAVVAAPGSHRVVLENQTTRVLEVTIAPGEREPQHTHRWPSVMVVHRPARIRYYSDDTLTFTSPKQPAPAALEPRVSWLDPEWPHSVENIDSHPYQAFRIEFKQPWPGTQGAASHRDLADVGRPPVDAGAPTRAAPPAEHQ